MLRFVSLWGQYERGHLLRAGGIEDQPTRYIEAMEILSAEVGRRERVALERRRQRSAGGYADAGRKPLRLSGLGPGAKVERII